MEIRKSVIVTSALVLALSAFQSTAASSDIKEFRTASVNIDDEDNAFSVASNRRFIQPNLPFNLPWNF